MEGKNMGNIWFYYGDLWVFVEHVNVCTKSLDLPRNAASISVGMIRMTPSLKIKSFEIDDHNWLVVNLPHNG
jgi:hypothetical protein